MVSPQHKKKIVRFLVDEESHSVRRACKIIGLSRSTFHYQNKQPSHRGEAINKELIQLSIEHSRYGYRRITVLLRRLGWQVSANKVQRIRRKEGLQVSQIKRKKPVRNKEEQKIMGAVYPNHVWSWDFVSFETACGKSIRIMTLVDEYTRRFLAFHANRSLTHKDVLKTLKWAITQYGKPAYIRSDNGPEFIAKALKEKLLKSMIDIKYIDPGCPWQNAWIESFHGKLRDECLNQEIFYTLLEARIVLEEFRMEYNDERPHSSLGYLTPNKFYQKTKEERSLNLIRTSLPLQID